MKETPNQLRTRAEQITLSNILVASRKKGPSKLRASIRSSLKNILHFTLGGALGATLYASQTSPHLPYGYSKFEEITYDLDPDTLEQILANQAEIERNIDAHATPEDIQRDVCAAQEAIFCTVDVKAQTMTCSHPDNP